MNRKMIITSIIAIGLLTAVFALTNTGFSQGETIGDQPAVISRSREAITWQAGFDFESAVLTVVDPAGEEQELLFSAGETILYSLVDAAGNSLKNGTYLYKLQLQPVLSPQAQATIAAAGKSLERGPSIMENLRAEGELPDVDLSQTGRFTIIDGEPAQGELAIEETGSQEGSNQRRAPTTKVITETLYVDGDIITDFNIYSWNTCIGADCEEFVGESFGSDMLRLKEENLRIHFDDVSNSGAFPNDDWRILINDTTNGGQEYFAIEAIEQNAGNSTVPFRIMGGADDDALVIAADGDVGFSKHVGVGTLSPNNAIEFHVLDGDSPTVRLEQDNSMLYTPQTWDLFGNESNFALRDVTHGSKLPVRVIPNSASNSLYMNASGIAVAPGVDPPANPGTPTVNATLHVINEAATFRVENLDNSDGSSVINLDLDSSGNMILAGGLDAGDDVTTSGDINGTNVNASGDLEVTGNTVLSGSLQVDNTSSGVTTLSLDDSGNLVLYGLLTEGSDKFSKENIVPVDQTAVLDKLADIPISTWNYRQDADDIRHMGPMAQDFHAAFGLGVDDRHIASLDVNGVTLAGLQELYTLVQDKEDQISLLESEISQLEEENSDLEQRLTDLEAAVEALLATRGE